MPRILLTLGVCLVLAFGSSFALAQDDCSEEDCESAEQNDEDWSEESSASDDEGFVDDAEADAGEGDATDSELAGTDGSDDVQAPSGQASEAASAESPAGGPRDRFERARRDAQQLPERPDNQTFLRLYALLRQATDGDNQEPKPGMENMTARAQWQAWEEMKGMSSDDAMAEYAGLVESLK